MFGKDTNVIRGHSEREVELKVREFIYMRDEVHDEEWKAEEPLYKPARMLGYKPWSCVVNRVK